MVRISLACAIACLANADPPPVKEKAQFARWMVQTMDWGVLSTISTRSEASTPGDAFGNPNSIAEAGGVPYFYVSNFDASMQDVFQGGNSKVSLALSEAQLTGDHAVADCTIGGALSDPENPPCARLAVSGHFLRVDNTTDEHDTAKEALFARHPSFKNLPEDHGFFVAKLDITGLWLINYFGGAAHITPEDYFAADPSSTLFAKRLRAIGEVDDRPDPKDKIGTARWMTHNLNWGVLSTVSSRAESGFEIGDPFGNPNSFADENNGALYYYVSNLDSSMVDVFNAGNTRVSWALSEAQLSGTNVVPDCVIGQTAFADPGNPPCARLVMSGEFTKLDNTTAEHDVAKKSLFDKHPSFTNLPEDHGFFVGKVELDGIWLIDFFGGAANIDPKDYYAYSQPAMTV